MLPRDLERRLSDLIAFQCVLVALRGASPDASEEMLWQTFLVCPRSAVRLRTRLVRRARRHGLPAGGRRTRERTGHGGSARRTSPKIHRSCTTADLVLPVSVDGCTEGTLVLAGGGEPESDRAGQIDILTAEAATMLARAPRAPAQRRSTPTGQTGGRIRQPRQEPAAGQHEPRDPHAHDGGARLRQPAGRPPSSPPSSGITWRPSAPAAKLCSR